MLPSLPSLGSVENDFHLGVEFGCYDGGLFDGVYNKMLKKDLHLIYLKRFLLLQGFEFEVHDKGKTRALQSPSSLLLPLLKGCLVYGLVRDLKEVLLKANLRSFFFSLCFPFLSL